MYFFFFRVQASIYSLFKKEIKGSLFCFSFLPINGLQQGSHVEDTQTILGYVEHRSALDSSSRFCEPDSVLAEVEHGVVSAHEDIPENPERTTWGRYVECHEPTDADGLP